MTDVTCIRCHSIVPAALSDMTIDGAICQRCLVAAATEPARATRLARELDRSTGRKQVIAGGIMLVFALVIVSLGISGGTVVVVPVAMMFGAIYELVAGLARLSRPPPAV